MASYKLFLLCVFLYLQTELYQFVETCITVDGGKGVCVSIDTCAPFVTLLQQENTNPNALWILRDANCGYIGKDPYVCCPLPAPPTTPSTVTPDKSIPPSDFITAFPEPPVCGFSNVFSRMLGRVNTDVDVFPWITLLGYRAFLEDSTQWLCGGSLISQHHVLTSAHCINDKHSIKKLYVVRLGNNMSDDEDATHIDILIKNKIKHEKYNATSFTNDIGILVLERDVEFTNFIRPICIPTRSDLRANSFAHYQSLYVGSESSQYPSLLQFVQLPVLDNLYCIQAYDNSSAVIDERVMCVRFEKDGIRPAKGDGGRPLMKPDYNVVEATTYFYQIGVVSYGPSICEEVCLPDMFTRVTHFIPWLHKQVLGLDE